MSLPPDLSSQDALFLDFDGTLSPICDDPEMCALPEGGAAILERLAQRLGGALALISGRDLRDLARRTPPSLWRAGGHGLEVAAPGETPPETRPAAPNGLKNAIETAISGLEGVRAEDKGPVIAVHYRAAPHHHGALLERLLPILQAEAGYSLQQGKMVLEAKPAAANKGTALRAMMLERPFAGRRPVMIGDDATDEQAMDVAIELGGWAIKIGDGDSLARHRLQTPREVWSWLTVQAG